MKKSAPPKKRRQISAPLKKKRAPKPTKKPESKKRKPTKSTPPPKPTKSPRPPPKKPKKRQAPKRRPPARRREPKPKAPPREVLPDERRYDDEPKSSATSFPETRTFNNANALLGYLEGRPGIERLLSAAPMRAGEERQLVWSAERRQEVKERLEATAPALAQKERNPESYPEWMRRALEALEFADDGGLVGEFEIDSESGPGDAA